MKTTICVFALCLLATGALFSQTINNLQAPTSVNEDGSAPDASAILDVQSTTQGMRLPNMTTAQRDAIAFPAPGLLIYNTTDSDNTANGRNALFSNTTGSNNTALGKDADVLFGNLTKATAIGYNAAVGCSNCMALGGSGADAVKVGIGTATPLYKLHIANSTSGLAINSGFGTGMLITGESPQPRIYFEHPVAPTGQRVMLMNFQDGNFSWKSTNDDGTAFIQQDILVLETGGNVGIGLTPSTNRLEVNGDASKTSAGDWLANSDARLKTNIRPLDSEEILQKMLALQGITYEWNDNETGSERPEGTMYGFTAQNIQQVFPELVTEDNLGFLQTAYGTYDAMTVEAIRALVKRQEKLESENAELRRQLQQAATLKTHYEALESRLEKLEAALGN